MPIYIFKDAHDFTISGGNFGNITNIINKRPRNRRSTRRRRSAPTTATSTSSKEDESSPSSPTSSEEEGSNPSFSSSSAAAPSHIPATSVHTHSLTFPNIPQPRPTSRARAEFLISRSHTSYNSPSPTLSTQAAQALQHPQSLALAATITDVDARY
ncbi:hypothetical protein P691DRAFT_763637 [Macrolepiota fuliginosa MF-IS2]|uniref:Uncharacterized protein n=1 Tax=Macrolepiota fuliginosa MF-IS2 TaxID=1400762 RepID=A0A9P6C018_9AGAR|nr:hypothetical protein P691DRAFT_763637 [Macrolepiota fuliginosa MF-IS2]